MKLRKGYLILGFLVLLSLVLAACGGGAPEEGAGEEASAAEVEEEAPAAEEATGAEEPATEEEAGPTQVQATLTVQEGEVELARAGEEEYTVVTGTVQVSSGDTIRTGEDGIALITFLDDTETTLFPDTVLVIESFVQNEDESYAIQLVELIGEIFARVNFTNPNSQQEVATPYGVAAVRGTGYWVTVYIPEPLASLLLSGEFGELSDFLEAVREFIETGDAEGLISFLEGICGYISADVGAGAIGFMDLPGDLYTVGTGRNIRSGMDEACEQLETIIGDITRYCGDGSCDPYLGEDAATCSADCG